MGRLDGKRARVSGTGGGIGRATALVLAREGAHVVGCDLNEETSAETVRLARAAGGRMDAIAPADLGAARPVGAARRPRPRHLVPVLGRGGPRQLREHP